MKRSHNLTFWLSTGLFCLVSVVLFFPGSMGNDSLSQWYQVNGVLPIDDWHPPMIVHLWSFLNVLIEGPFGLLLLQQALYWSGLGMIVQQTLKVPGTWGKLSALFLVGFFPVVWFSTASVWKDALMGSSLLFSVGAFLSMTEGRSLRTMDRPWLLSIVFTALVLSCGFRHNALLAVLPLTFAMVFRLLDGQGRVKKAIVALVTLALISFSSSLVNKIGVEKHYPHLINQLVFWNLAGLSIDSGEMLIPEEAFVHPDSAKLEVLERYYEDQSNNKLVFSSGIVNPSVWENDAFGRQFLISGLRTIAKSPDSYLAMRARFLKHFSGLGKWMPYCAYIFETRYWEGDDKLDLPMYRMAHPKALSKFEGVARIISHLGFYNVIPYLLVLLIEILVLLTIVRKSPMDKTSPTLLCLGFSAMFYWLPYVIIAPSNDFRYHLWTIQVTILIGAIVIFNRVHSCFGRNEKLNDGHFQPIPS